MNWKRGFKRITHVLAIVIAVACGWFSGVSPVQRYDAVHITSSHFRLWQMENELARAEKEWKPLVPSDLYNKRTAELKKTFEGERTKIEFLENKRKKSFWYNLSTAELIGMVVLYGLGGAVVGYVGTWVVLWYGGLAIFILVGWFMLGFADKKPNDEQKE